MKTAVELCTCQNTACPNHPGNHDRGCTPCIEKNLRMGEIPACFSNLFSNHEEMDGYTIEAFSRFALNNLDKLGRSRSQILKQRN